MRTDPRALVMSERDLMEAIRALVDDLGLHAFHARDSRGCWGPGFSDLLIVGRAGCIYRECKTEHGSLTPEQHQWGEALKAAGQRWGVWRPKHLLSGQIGRELADVAAIQATLFDSETITERTSP
jgi:hypothetical protein